MSDLELDLIIWIPFLIKVVLMSAALWFIDSKILSKIK